MAEVGSGRDAIAIPAEIANQDAAPKAKNPRHNNSSIDGAISEAQSGSGLRQTLHGDIFQLKLLMLFVVRGIHLQYNKFQLGTEMPGQGGKFDDLIFHYQEAPRGNYRYRFLQAKHKQSDDKKITVSDLLNQTDGDFSLQKYFHSYRKEIANRGMNVQDCIICTNIGFDENFLGSEDFLLTLIDSDDEILAIAQEPNFDKVPARYKLNKTPRLVELLCSSSDLHYLSKKLLECIKSQKKLTLKVDIFKIYHVALVNEKVIVRNEEKWTFHEDFIENLLPNAIQFHQIIFELWSKENKKSDYCEFSHFLQTSTFTCSNNFGQDTSSNRKIDDIVTEREIDDFLEKLVFAVDMPNEVRLGEIINKEVGQHFNLRECDFQSSFILEKMLDWFKQKRGTELTEGNNLFERTRQKMMALRASAFSIDFREKYLPPFFGESFQYRDATISEKANQLEEFLNSPEDNKILQISTRSCRCTAVKILSALEKLPRFKDSVDGYLLIKSEDLELKRHTKEWVKAAMKEEKSHEVLVVIGETPVQISVYKNELMSDEQPRKKMIYICSGDLDEAKNFERDEFDCQLMSEETINRILSTKVTFQGNDVTIENLVMEKNRLNEILDSSSIEEILFFKKKVTIPSFASLEFEKSLWIHRSLIPAPLISDYGTIKGFYEKCRFHPETNHIEWLIEKDDEKSKIWKQVQDLLEKKVESTQTIDKTTLKAPVNIANSLPENKLVDQSTVIITGVAGSGKSTILSRHYEHVKKDDSNLWVIKINLINHSKYLAELEIPISKSNEMSTTSAIDILINFPGIICDSFFARSLLRNRLNITGGVVLLLDGFDEIDSECQNNVIKLIKAISNGKTKLDRLIVTARPHLTKKLQDALFQFAFGLENLGKEDQVKYLTQYWRKKANLSNKKLIKQFANSLVERVTEAVKDKERAFIGIPLQCRILAECFQSRIEMSTENDLSTDLASEFGPSFSIAQLYRMLFKKKSDIFLQEKATGSAHSDLIVKWALEEFLQTLDSFHLKLAIGTIFDEKNVNILWPPQQLSDRQHNEDKMEEKMRRYSLQFGLTSSATQQPRNLEFLHRTFAEYLVAEFLYKGFLDEENKDKDRIRDSDESLRNFMIHHILVENAYEGVRVFLDSMLNGMVTTDKTWRNTISKSLNESRPNQLQRFAQHFSFSMFDYLSSGKGAEALLTCISEGNVGIFDLMLDCLGAIYDRNSVQEIVTKAITHKYAFLFFSRNVEIHQRIVIFFRDAKDSVVNELLRLMIEHFPFARAEHFSNFSRKERKLYLAFLLDFMEKHQKNLQSLFDLEYLSCYLLESKGFFIFDAFYDDELRRFIKLLVTNIYSKKWSIKYFEENLDYGGKAMSSQNENWVNGSIEKILLILKDLKQDKILETMSGTVLTSNPNLYEKFYGPCVLDKDIISDLHEKAKKGDRDAVSELKRQFRAAAVVGNEDVCEKMLRILSTGNEDWKWIDDTGFLYYALQDAIKCCRADMFTLIMRMAHRHFDRQSRNGQEALRHVLTLQDSNVMVDPLIQSFGYDTLNRIIQMKITEEEDWSDLFSRILLFTDSPMEMANHFENGFSLLLRHILIHFNTDQLERFIRLIKSQHHKIETKGINHSIWAMTIARARSTYDTDCDHFLKLVASRLNTDDVKNLLLHEEDNVVVLYQTALIESDTNLVNKMCRHLLSQETRDDISKDFNEKAPNIILDMFTQYSKETLPYKVHIKNLIHFFVEHANDEQTLKLIHIVTLLIGGSTYWEHLFDHLSNETILKILTRISELKGVGNENKRDEAVKKLLTIDDIRGHGAIVIRAAQQRGEEFIKEMWGSLSERIQNEITEFFRINAPQRIEELFFCEEPKFWNCKSEIRWNLLHFFLNHCNEIQLSKLVKVVTASFNVGKGNNCSIWGSCIEDIDNEPDYWLPGCPRAQVCRQLETFLENVNTRLGGDSVIKLLLHNDGQQQGKEIIFIRIFLSYTSTLCNDSSKFTSRFTLKNNVLSQEKQLELRQQLTPFINQFLQEKTINKFDWNKWIRLLHFYLDYSNNDSNLSANFFHVITHKDYTERKENQISIWESLFMDLAPDVVSELSHLLRHVKEKLGEDVLKKLALEKNGKGRFILGEALRTHAYGNNVKNMYAYLSTENRNEIFKILFSDPFFNSRLNVEIGSRAFSDNTNGELLMYFELVRTARQKDDGICSLWSNYVEKVGYSTKFEQFLELIFDTLGEVYLKELMLHDDGNGQSVISRALSQGENLKVDEMFSLLSPSSQVQVRDKAYTTPGLIEQMLSSKGSDYWSRHYLKINSADGTASNLPDGFDILASYFLEKFNLEQLKQFITFITSLDKVEGKTRSIWGDYIEKACSINAMEEERKRFSARSIDRLLNVVSSKLGATAVVQLLYHYNGSRVVINYLTLPENQEIVVIAFHHLEQHEKNRKIEFRPIDGRPLKEQCNTVQKEKQPKRGKREKKLKAKK